MRRILIYMVLAVMLGGAAGCSRPRNIPAKELKEIFKDAFIVNAYSQLNPGMAHAMAVDSLDIYRPILKRYGYRLRDLEYTVHHISKQKSRKLSDIVELSIEELKKETEYLNARVAVLDTVNARAGRAFMRTALFEERISTREIRDTAKLRITVPLEEGAYELSYSYLVDSLDQNSGLRVTGSILDTLGRRRSVISQPLTRRQRQSPEPHRFETTAADTMLVLLFGNYGKSMKTPGLTIDSLRLVHYLPDEVAVDSLMKMIFPIDYTPYYGNEESAAQDSGALRTDARRIDAPGVGDARP